MKNFMSIPKTCQVSIDENVIIQGNVIVSNNCKFIPVLSRENIDGYFHGYVQDAILNLGIDLAESSVYACGSITMINDAFKILNANGLDKKSFYSDAFVSSN